MLRAPNITPRNIAPSRVFDFELISTPKLHQPPERLTLDFVLFGDWGIWWAPIRPERGNRTRSDMGPRNLISNFIQIVELAGRCLALV